MNKLIRDGKVAVLVSPGYGAGWYSWHRNEELLYDPSIVEWVEQQAFDKVLTYMELKHPDVYCGGLEDLEIKWVSTGDRFRIDEHDGAESLVLEKNEYWLTA
jgi:hypothetical protein